MLSNLKPPLAGCGLSIVDPKFTAALQAFFVPFKGFRLACVSMRIPPVLPLRKARPTLLTAMLAEIDRLRRQEENMIRMGRPPVV